MKVNFKRNACLKRLKEEMGDSSITKTMKLKLRAEKRRLSTKLEIEDLDQSSTLLKPLIRNVGMCQGA
jgi:hypothetical protein